MAFSFGSSPAPAFGASTSAPAFGAPSSAPAFGFGAASSAASLFGTASAPAFGASSAPAFGAPAAASTPSLFGGASTPSLFGASSTPSLFGAASTPSLFGGASAPPASTPSFSFGSAASQATSIFGTAAAGAGAGQGALALPGTAGTSGGTTVVTYTTKYDDLHPSIQKELQDIQGVINNYRDECDQLDKDQRLHDNAALKKSLDEEARALKSTLQGLAGIIKADGEALDDVREKVMALLRSTERAVRTFQRAKLWREAPQQYTGGANAFPQVQELLSAPVVLPNPYLELAIQGFQEALGTYRQLICELEAAVPPDALAAAQAGAGAGGKASLSTTLPTVVSHMHDFFVHVAAQLEQVHNEVERTKDQFLAQRQAEGDSSNPFADARRHIMANGGSSRPALPAAAGAYHHHPHHHHHHHAHHALGAGHGAGHQLLHYGTPHGPGASPSPGAFGTLLPGAGAGGAASPFGGGAAAGAAGAADAGRKASGRARRK